MAHVVLGIRRTALPMVLGLAVASVCCLGGAVAAQETKPATAVHPKAKTTVHGKTGTTAKAPVKTAAKTPVKAGTKTPVKAASTRTSSRPRTTTATAATAAHRTGSAHVVRVVAARRSNKYVERFTASSFADNLTLGDVVEGEDPVVRQAAIEALGNMNGTALAIDPSNGRILAMVNQKLALSSGAEPCSTIKLSVALAALQEGIVKRDTPVNLGGGYHLNLTEALAHSNNAYFETLGRSLGFERVKHYANELGLGELAGYNIEGEQLGIYPDQELPKEMGGVGRMCSFGESVSMTPLQLGAIVSAIANGGTLYYLQHPQTPEEIAAFEPKVKRTLEISELIPEMQDGMLGATTYGTARSLRVGFKEFPVMGKTGTCSNNGTRFGWFGSYADTPAGRIVTVIFLQGGRPTFGPKAAELTGQFYRALWDKSYFQPKVVAAAADAPVTGN